MRAFLSDPYSSKVVYCRDAKFPGAKLHRLDVQQVTTRPWPRVYYIATRIHASQCPARAGAGSCNCKPREELIPHYEQ
jgi:hypothetical protein